MQRTLFPTTLILPLVFSTTATAEVIYSNLRDVSIPDTFGGVYLSILSGNSSGSEFSGYALS